MQPLANARYDSVSDFLASLDELRNPQNDKNYWNDPKRSHGAHWLGAGCQTANDVRKVMNDGWPEGRERADDMIGKTGPTNATPIDRRRKLTRCELGDSLDIHSVYRGELATAWTRAVRRVTRGPQHLSILANMLTYGFERPDVLMWRGIAAITLADKLEAVGYRVRIVVGFGGRTSYGSEPISCRIVVKDHAMPLDLTTCSAVTLPGFFRALGHQWTINHASRIAKSGSMSVEQCIMDEGEILLSHEISAEDTAIAFVNDQINKLNDLMAA